MRSLIIAVFLGLSLSACGEEKVQPVPVEGVVQLSDQFTGDFDLIDKNGAPVEDEDFEGKVMLIYFGFTHCPDICPVDVGVMSATLNELGDEAGEVAPIFISVDPERDTPEALNNFFAFDDRIVALTGSVEAAEEARAAFKVYAQKQPLPDSALEYTVQHQRYFFITDRSGQPTIGIAGGLDPQELAALLRREIEKS